MQHNRAPRRGGGPSTTSARASDTLEAPASPSGAQRREAAHHGFQTTHKRVNLTLELLPGGEPIVRVKTPQGRIRHIPGAYQLWEVLAIFTEPERGDPDGTRAPTPGGRAPGGYWRWHSTRPNFGR